MELPPQGECHRSPILGSQRHFYGCSEQNTLEYLYTTAKIYQSDIAGFGSKAASHFLFWDDWLEYDWLNRYQDAFFQVNVDFQVHSSSFLQRIS